MSSTASYLPLPRTRTASFAVAAAVLALYGLSRWWLKGLEPASVPAILVALLPLPGLLYLYAAWVFAVANGDELARRIALEGVAIGLGLSFATVLLLSQLDHAGLVSTLGVKIQDIAHLMVAFTFFGVWRARQRYE
jgi:hypothetical protein